MTTTYIPKKTLKIALAAASTASAVYLQPALLHAQTSDLVVTSIASNGELTFADDVVNPDGFEVQWASTLEGPWLTNWDTLSLIKRDGESTTVKVPMFYRVARVREAESFPSAASTGDFVNGGIPDAAKFQLGRLLFFDKILSGNRNISCATCHHSHLALGDGLSLSLGEGATGLGLTRTPGEVSAGVQERVPRNAPHLFNLGATEFTTLFHDGRVSVDASEPSGFAAPESLPDGLDNVLAAQAMFPVTSATEMAGSPGSNPVADLVAAGDVRGVWDRLARRVRSVTGYVPLFINVFPDVATPSDITFVHIANAIAEFEAQAWKTTATPFDRYLDGEPDAMSGAAQRGMRLFYGRARCAQCHSGTFQTDHDFHAIAMPQIGPGKGDGAGAEDFGRERVTGLSEDRYKFRTPSLRNVAITGPWGHDGAFDTLRAVVLHHLDPNASFLTYDPSQAVLPPRPDLDALDLSVFNTRTAPGPLNRWRPILAASELTPVSLTNEELEDLMDFLRALTDPASLDMRRDIPFSVPSGLPVAD